MPGFPVTMVLDAYVFASVSKISNEEVYCEARSIRRCYVKLAAGISYLENGEALRTQEGVSLIYINFPLAGSIIGSEYIN